MIQYEKGLSKEDRSKYTMRLVTLHGILANEEDIEYKHEIWTNTSKSVLNKIKGLVTGNQHCGTAACALGHAILYRDRFPGMVVHEHSPEVQRILGIAPQAPLDSIPSITSVLVHTSIFSAVMVTTNPPKKSLAKTRWSELSTISKRAWAARWSKVKPLLLLRHEPGQRPAALYHYGYYQ